MLLKKSAQTKKKIFLVSICICIFNLNFALESDTRWVEDDRLNYSIVL